METPPPFVVFGLPRSRTYWLSRFLSYGGWHCGHDEVRHVRGLDDVRSWLSQDRMGTVETAAAPFWRLMVDIRPDVRIATVRRPIPQVIDSLSRTGMSFDMAVLTRHLTKLNRKLDQIERLPDVLSVDYAALTDAATCRKIFEHCLPFPHDAAWWARLDAVNLQVDLAAQFRYLRAYAPQLRKAEAVCARRIRSIIRPPKMGDPDDSGITIQEEPFIAAWEGAKSIMAEHCLAVGEEPEDWRALNVPLMEKLDDLGAMLVMTARCNGRMLGYLGTVLSPSLKEVGVIQATQLGLFVCEDAAGHGLGPRLTKAAIDAAWARGAKQVFMRSGVRGDGPRMHAVFRRLGAKEDGRLYRIDREAA